MTEATRGEGREVKLLPKASLLRELPYRMIGRASLCLDWVYRWWLEGRAERDHRLGRSYHDESGLVLRGRHRVALLARDAEVILADFGSAAHSLWRAQELSLFAQSVKLIERPTLDFGCGDGSFAAVLFEKVDFGVDYDPKTLVQARESGVYGHLIQSSERRIPLPDESICTLISNSVLEHVRHLDAIIAEINRVLRVGGRAIVTVPTINYHRHLAVYFGEAEARVIDALSYHRNLLSIEQWTHRLTAHGLEIVASREYQSDRFTFWYRMLRVLGRHGLGQLFPNLGSAVLNRCKRTFMRMVRRSIAHTRGGANAFIVARKI